VWLLQLGALRVFSWLLPLAAPDVHAATYDLTADVVARRTEAERELGPRTRVAVLEEVFVIADPRGHLASTVATTERALRAYFNGRFGRKPEKAVSVYLFPSAKPYSDYCRRRWNADCISPYGFYLPSERRIVMNVGPGIGTLTHELVHPIIETDFPEAPDWLNEGVASLYEGFTMPRDGEIVGVKNWRHPRLLQALNSKSRRELAQLERLFGMPDTTFRGEDESLHYAMARYFCLWLERNGHLWAFYRAWRDDFAADPTGTKAFERAVGMTPAQLQKTWESWVRTL